MNNIKKGETSWFIPDGYIPEKSSGELESHESICILNCNEEIAHILVTVYFEDMDPIENIPLTVNGKRTNHARTRLLQKEGKSIPVGVPYAMEVSSDIPVIVQYSRLDSTQAANSLMTTMAYPLK
jgi:hypothetical protein